MPRVTQLVKRVKRNSRLLLDEYRREKCRGQGTQLPGGMVGIVGLQLRSKHKGLAGAFKPHRIKSLVSKPFHTLKDSNSGPWHGRAGRKEGRGAKNL